MKTCPTCGAAWLTETLKLNCENGSRREWTVECENHHAFEIAGTLQSEGGRTTAYSLRQPELIRRPARAMTVEIPTVEDCVHCGNQIQPGQFYAREGEHVRHLGCWAKAA